MSTECFESINYYELDPCDMLVLDRVPTLQEYLDAWFAHCKRESIDFAIPRVKVSQDVMLCDTTLWFPELGLCRANMPLPCWELSEPFASQGDHTRHIHFWELELLIPAERVPRHVQTMAAAYQHDFSNGVPVALHSVDSDLESEMGKFIHRHVHLQAPREKVGYLCFFKRGWPYGSWYGGSKRSLDRHYCRGEKLSAHYLLSHTIMTQVASVIASDRTMRVIE